MNNCEWLHVKLEPLPIISHPFNLDDLPDNGIYFMYERGEIWGHGGLKQRIVRVGTHKDGNFKSRINEHYLYDEKKMQFDVKSSRPHDRSIFRKNIGRAILGRNKDNYLELWNTDCINRDNRESVKAQRNIKKEKDIEWEITHLLRNNFPFRFIIIEDQEERMGSGSLESNIIGTLARCEACVPSKSWLGNHSPVEKIRKSGLWQVQHLSAPEMSENDKRKILKSINKTKEWIKRTHL